MRIAIIGDLQYWDAQEEDLAVKMHRIKKHGPGLSIVMGDIGGRYMRSQRGLLETKDLVSMTGCPFHVIFGNHDVEYWPDNVNEYDPDHTYRQVFGCEPYRSYIINGVLVVCLSIERQPPETMITPYTVYISDGQYEWAKNEIEKNRDKPCVIIAHAPVAGSGLRCERPMHTAALDTYLDQTFKAERWVELLHNNPQIRVWISAHFHMGHDYDTAITQRDGVVHISCGVMTCCTRDERAHTRLVDISEDQKMTVYTLDHNNDGLLILDAEIDLTGKAESRGRISRHDKYEILIGTDDAPDRVWYDVAHRTYYVSTDKGMLWEYDEYLHDFCGAVSYKKKVDKLTSDGNRLYMAYADGGYASVEIGKRGRWAYKDTCKQDIQEEKCLQGEHLPDMPYTTRASKEGVYIKLK